MSYDESVEDFLTRLYEALAPEQRNVEQLRAELLEAGIDADAVVRRGMRPRGDRTVSATLWRWWKRFEWEILRPAACRVLTHVWCEWDDRGDGVWYRVCDRCCQLQEQAAQEERRE